MSKYPASDFLNKYSDWHWKNAGKWCYLTDIDRLWVEVRNFKRVLRPKIITDIKREGDTITPVEKAIYLWFEKREVPVYIVQPDHDFKNFKVIRFRDGEVKYWTEQEYINWLQKL